VLPYATSVYHARVSTTPEHTPPTLPPIPFNGRIPTNIAFQPRIIQIGFRLSF
jgi:hypothetical protein